MTKLIIGAIIATFIVIFIFTKLDPHLKPSGSDTETCEVGSDYLSLTVSGEVMRPGTYVLELDATLDDLITIAGGPTSNADARAYLTTTVLEVSINYYIAPLYDKTDVCGDHPFEKVNINSDPKEVLMSINGIGSSVASSIISYRETNGSFTYLEQVMRVNGIGNATFEKIKNYIILQ